MTMTKESVNVEIAFVILSEKLFHHDCERHYTRDYDPDRIGHRILYTFHNQIIVHIADLRTKFLTNLYYDEYIHEWCYYIKPLKREKKIT